MKYEKISTGITFWETENEDAQNYYGYVFKKSNGTNSSWTLKRIKRSSNGVKSLYMETEKKFRTLKECKEYLKTLENGV